MKKNDAAEKLVNLKSSRKAMIMGTAIITLSHVTAYYKIIGTNMNLSSLYFPAMPIDFLNAILAFIGLYISVNYVLKIRKMRFLNNTMIWIGKFSMVIYVIHCVEYHSTIPFMNVLITNLLSFSKPAAYAAFLINPFLQIVICMIGLYIYVNYKFHLANENRNCNNLV